MMQRVLLTLLWLALTGCASPPDASPVIEDTSLSQDDDVLASITEDTSRPMVDTGSSADTPPVRAPDYPLDDVLRVNHLQCKGTHNSTHVEPEFPVDEWRYTHRTLTEQLAVHGVRQVELDVHYTEEGTFDVFHLPLIDQETTCGTLVGCLGEIKEWSDENPHHHLLFILVEPKDEIDFALPIAGHYDELDAEILSVWPPDRVLRPDDVRGDHPSLRAALETDGWPTLGETRQKAMFVMLDSSDHRDGYLVGHPNLEGRVLFARDGQGEPWSSVIESGSAEQKESAALAGYLVRARADAAERSDADNRTKAEGALSSSAHFISSDFPYAVEDGYWFDLTGGTPSRCHPLTAPESCGSEDIE